MSLSAALRLALGDDHRPVGRLSGDDAWANRQPDGPAIDAAVLVAFVERPRPGIILTRRTETLRKHAGQVAFPGGRIDAGEDAVAAALREAQEEIALDPATVSIIGLGPRYLTGTNFRVTPVLATIPAGLAFRPNPAEVARVFEMPAEILFSPANRLEQFGEWEGAQRRYFQIGGHEETVWGATAGMVINLAHALGLDDDPAKFNGHAP